MSGDVVRGRGPEGAPCKPVTVASLSHSLGARLLISKIGPSCRFSCVLPDGIFYASGLSGASEPTQLHKARRGLTSQLETMKWGVGVVVSTEKRNDDNSSRRLCRLNSPDLDD